MSRLWQWLHDRFICDLPRPYSIIGDYLGYIITYYTEELFAPRTGSKYNLSGIDTAIDIALEQQADGTISKTVAFADSLRTLRTMLQDYKALVESNAADCFDAGSVGYVGCAETADSRDTLTQRSSLISNGVVAENPACVGVVLVNDGAD